MIVGNQVWYDKMRTIQDSGRRPTARQMVPKRVVGGDRRAVARLPERGYSPGTTKKVQRV